MKHIGQDCSCDETSGGGAASYYDCSGNALSADARLVQCDQLIAYSIAAIDASATAQTTVSTGARAFRVKANVSAREGNALTLVGDGLYVAPAEVTDAYYLSDCNGTALTAGSKVAACDMVAISMELTYELANTDPPLE